LQARVGKPSPVMMRIARKELGIAASETIMIGDTMQTDILGGCETRTGSYTRSCRR
jgi:NagD protein